jgi:EPS-associated MarR family transcriptional regulator
MSSLPSALGAQDPEAARLAVLRLLEADPLLTQRRLSQALGLSLGKTHYLLHALLDKGLVKIGNFRRSKRKTAYAYALTPAGLSEKLRLTRSFLTRKEMEYLELQSVIAELRADLERIE